jgi:hypothetical protein
MSLEFGAGFVDGFDVIDAHVHARTLTAGG